MNEDKLIQYVRKNKILLILSAALIILLLIQYASQNRSFSKNPDQVTTEKAQSADTMTNRNTRVPVQVDISKLQSLGILTEKVRVDTIAEQIRAVATAVPDESRISHIHTRVSGWMEKLYINKTGQQVKTGSKLAGIFSQELYASQMEYLAALKASRSGPQSVVIESASTRLKVLGMTDAQILELKKRGVATRLTTIIAPRNGVVLDLYVFTGMAVDPSMVLMTIADLSRIWILAEIPGSEKFDISIGTPVTIHIAFPAIEPIESIVNFIYPALTEGTRTIRVRMIIENPGNLLKPGLYGTAEFKVRPRKSLTVPRDAVVDEGERQYVFVLTAPGTFEPRSVKLGTQLQDRVEVIEGIYEGDLIVSSGVFLIDSESRLRASGNVGGGHGGHTEGMQDTSKQKNRPKKQQPSSGGGHQGHGG